MDGESRLEFAFRHYESRYDVSTHLGTLYDVCEDHDLNEYSTIPEGPLSTMRRIAFYHLKQDYEQWSEAGSLRTQSQKSVQEIDQSENLDLGNVSLSALWGQARMGGGPSQTPNSLQGEEDDGDSWWPNINTYGSAEMWMGCDPSYENPSYE